jgi:glycosyltransferase involved in cell wall biosynthesis
MRQRSILVANPGAIAELPMMAAALASAGLLRKYFVPLAFSTAAVPAGVARLLPPALRRRIEVERRRRLVAEPIAPGDVQLSASTLECLFVLSQRVRALRSAQPVLLGLRNARLDRQVALRIRSDDAGLITTYTAALRSLRRSRFLSVPSYLEYPIPHHRFAEAILREEAARQPAYAPTLQFHRFSRELWAQLEAEVASADSVLVLSTFHKRTFSESGVPEEKLTMTHLGVDLELFKPRPRLGRGAPFRVLFVGQITQRKGLSYLIRAFEQADLPDAELTLVGAICGSASPWIGTRAVRHKAHVPRWELPMVYAEADVYVLPSIIEGFPLTALEAMASGLPVIVSENTFGSDVITDGIDGYVVPIRDSEAIADRLRYLHDHPSERSRIGAAARRRAEHFSWKRYGQQVVDLVSRSTRTHSFAEVRS